MTKIDIVSGFLGAGKTTLIKKLLKEALAGTKVVLIENEFGEIGIDGGFLKEAGIEIREMNSGCICCSLVGDFGTSLKEVMEKYAPERILIEPSGVGKLSDVAKAIQNVTDEDANLELNSAVTVVDVTKAKVYIKNFGEFFTNQIESAGTIILTRTDKADEKKIEEAVEMIREYNKKATIITTPLDQLTGKEILDTFEGNNDLEAELLKEILEHHHDEDEDEHEHHHHHHDEDEDEHEHHHHHHHEAEADEDGVVVHHADHHHHHHHHGEGHHDADEVFVSWGMETPHKYTMDEINDMLSKLEDEEQYGIILRTKGMVQAEDGSWIEFDYVPGESDVRAGHPDVTGKICVIGSNINEENLEKLFRRR
ncbi:MAG: GTP-binding protein [Butyrivibrio sp.]|nr:GTP-binding protein [Butyrivibrio sp.]